MDLRQGRHADRPGRPDAVLGSLPTTSSGCLTPIIGLLPVREAVARAGPLAGFAVARSPGSVPSPRRGAHEAAPTSAGERGHWCRCPRRTGGPGTSRTAIDSTPASWRLLKRCRAGRAVGIVFRRAGGQRNRARSETHDIRYPRARCGCGHDRIPVPMRPEGQAAGKSVATRGQPRAVPPMTCRALFRADELHDHHRLASQTRADLDRQ